MTSTIRPRGRQPAQVYWVRRAMVVLTAFLLVFAIGRLLGGSGGSGGDTAGTVADHQTKSPTTTALRTTAPAAPYGPVGNTATGPGQQVALAQPSGRCDINDITVTPTISTATAGAPVRIGMQLTGIKAACTFEVSSKTLAVRITRGHTRIWTSQQCPTAIRTRTLVVRSAVPIPINVRWSGRRSDDTCSRSTGWSLPGNYTVTAAAIGSEPADKRFALLSPPRPVITKTITPKPHPTKTPTEVNTFGNGDNALPHKTPTAPVKTPTGGAD